MPSRTGLVSDSPVATTIATTTPWPPPAFFGVLRRRGGPDFGLDAPNGNQRRSAVESGTCLKIMVFPVRVRVPPLLFSRHSQGKRSALSERPQVESHLHHHRYHDEAHGGFTVHGGGTEVAPGGIEDLRNLYKEEEGEE